MLYFFDVRSMTFMYFMVELGEVRYVFCIRFKYVGRLQALDAVLVDIRNLVLEEEGVDALILIVRSNGNEQQVKRFHLFRLERL